MGIRLFLLVMISYLVLNCYGVYAHPPSSLEVNFEGKTVYLKATHKVSDPLSHYINRIEVYLNATKIIEQIFYLQEADYQKAIFYIPSLKQGDILKVKAYCNKSGVLEKEAEVKKEN